MMRTKTVLVAAATLFAIQTAVAQVVPSDTEAELKKALQLIERLTNQLAAQEARIEKLETASGSAAPANPVASVAPLREPPSPPVAAAPAEPPPAQDTEMGGHNMSMLEGPRLNIRGFFDFNFGVGSIANPLVFPIIDNG
jgi:hypothetical protein